MWQAYLILTTVKNARISLDQLRIKRQIDSQLCDSIFAAFVQACLNITLIIFGGQIINKYEGDLGAQVIIQMSQILAIF